MKKYKDLDLKKIREECELDFAHFTYSRGQCSCCYGPKDLPKCYWRNGVIPEGDDYTYILFKNAANGSGVVTKNDFVAGDTYIEYCCRDAEQKKLFCKLLSEQLGTDYIVRMPYSDKFCIVIYEARSYVRFNYNEKEAFLFCDGKVLDMYSVEQDNLTCVAAFWNTPDSLFVIREETHSYVTVVRRETPRGYVADTDCIRFVLNEYWSERRSGLMGVSIYANGVERSFDCGYISFSHLRENICLAYDMELYEVYSDKQLCFDNPKEYTRQINEILKNKRFKDEDEDIIDFLFASECGGFAKPATLKKIYALIKDVDFGKKIFTYAAYSDGKDYEHFKEFLLECIKHRSYMRWC